MRKFRERGIYLAPNGQSLVASKVRQTTADGRRILSLIGSEMSCFLFSRYQWANHGIPDYEVTKEGKLVARSQTVHCRFDELKDTCATAGAH
jgi:hypothetical protein